MNLRRKATVPAPKSTKRIKTKTEALFLFFIILTRSFHYCEAGERETASSFSTRSPGKYKHQRILTSDQHLSRRASTTIFLFRPSAYLFACLSLSIILLFKEVNDPILDFLYIFDEIYIFFISSSFH